jgi:DNA polymerase-3 subunit gamma/tau
MSGARDQALYRVYRPERFEEVFGQDEVVRVLQKAAQSKSPGHAYLFSGGRGTGKTTIARIFAKEVGCTPTDLYEIDAASNRGIDDVRALREAVATMPFESPYKVYIVDEVHMLTKEAFNALLKTLEEPPQHVIFILATTEMEKLPDTVISRCQHFVFRQPSMEDLKRYVLHISKKEKVKIDQPTAEIVALFGDGSYRDTLSVLEKIITSTKGDAIDADRAAEILGAPTHDLVNAVLRSIDAGDPSEGLSSLEKASTRHVDMKVFHRMLLAKLRAVLLLRYAPNMETELMNEFTPDDLGYLKTLAMSKEKRVNSHVLVEFLDASRFIGHTSAPSLPLELALIRVAGEKKE